MSALRWLNAGVVEDDGRPAPRRLVEVLIRPGSREAALALLLLAEHEGGLPFLLLESPWPADGSFKLLVDELLFRRNELAAVARRAGVALPDRQARPGDEKVQATARFVRELGALLDALPASLEGLVVALAPPLVVDAKMWTQSLNVLVTSPVLARARWVVVTHVPVLAEHIARVGPSVALSVDARTDDRTDMAHLADDLERASAGATTAGAARVGAASPRGVVPPVRRSWATVDPLRPERVPLPPSVPVAISETEAVPAEPTIFERVRALTLRATAASARGDSVAALGPIREARDLCFLHGRTEDGIRLEVMLGTYTVAAGARDAAIRLFVTARTHADEAKLPALACQAELARGCALASVPDLPRASVAFAEAGALAEAADQHVLALEGYRLAAEAALVAGLEPQAVQAWSKALAVAGEAEEPTATPSAAEIADRLAKVCTKHGLVTQAASLRARAAGLRGEVEKAQGLGPAGVLQLHDTVVSPMHLAFTQVPQGAAPPPTPAFPEGPVAGSPHGPIAPLAATVHLGSTAAGAAPGEEA